MFRSSAVCLYLSTRRKAPAVAGRKRLQELEACDGKDSGAGFGAVMAGIVSSGAGTVPCQGEILLTWGIQSSLPQSRSSCQGGVLVSPASTLSIQAPRRSLMVVSSCQNAQHKHLSLLKNNINKQKLRKCLQQVTVI